MQGVDKWDDAVSIRIYTVGAFWLVGCFRFFFFPPFYIDDLAEEMWRKVRQFLLTQKWGWEVSQYKSEEQYRSESLRTN